MSAIKIIKEVDGLRAVAIAAVLITHYLPQDWAVHRWNVDGVRLFFVISGYLITGILLKAVGESRDWKELSKVFYARRFLRIFPPYYALLLLSWAAGVGFPEGAGWTTALYVFNFHQGLSDNPFLYLGHLWSLSVEEQFYLLWPWLVIFMPKERLGTWIAICVALGPASRLVLALSGAEHEMIRGFPLSCFDALAAGAWLAWAGRGFGGGLLARWRAVRGWLGVVCYFAVSLKGFAPIPPVLDEVLTPCLRAVYMLALLDWAIEFRGSRLTALLRSPPLAYVGKISYGIYLFHFVTLFPLYKLIKLAGNPPLMAEPIPFALAWTALTLAVASISWHLFESPLLGLKRHFTYGAPGVPRGPEPRQPNG